MPGKVKKNWLFETGQPDHGQKCQLKCYFYFIYVSNGSQRHAE